MAARPRPRKSSPVPCRIKSARPSSAREPSARDRVRPSGRSIQAQDIAPDIEVLQDVPNELAAQAQTRGEASLPGHLKAEGEEQNGSQSYAPKDTKDDKALQT